MNSLLQRLMTDASRMTQDGQLQAATEAIQRALRAAHLDGPDGATSSAASGSFDPMAQFESFMQRATSATGPAGFTPGAFPGGFPAGFPTGFATGAPVASPTPAPIVIDGCVRVIDEERDAPSPRTTPAEPATTRAPDGASPERWTDGSFTHQGRTLAYKLFVPARAADAAPTSMPLVLMLHGCTQNPDDFATGTRMNELARQVGVVVVYPAQTQHANSQKCWNWFKSQHQQRGRGEPALLAALTQSIVAAEQIDPTRVYAAGLSAGGAMADILGQVYPDVFAAVGVHSGLPAGAATDLVSALAAMRGAPTAAPVAVRAAGARRAPVIVFHGDADATVSPSNATGVVKAALDGSGAAVPTTVEGRSPQGQSFTRTEHPGTDGRIAVEFWTLRGAGHAWSGGSASGSYTDPRGIDASAEMLRFFLTHSRAL
jgi:poly(hydroxyalkanoate) depolymerase family esterase